MQKLTDLLNEHARTAYDTRNDEAKKHVGHSLYLLRSKFVKHPTVQSYLVDKLKAAKP